MPYHSTKCTPNVFHAQQLAGYFPIWMWSRGVGCDWRTSVLFLSQFVSKALRTRRCRFCHNHVLHAPSASPAPFRPFSPFLLPPFCTGLWSLPCASTSAMLKPALFLSLALTWTRIYAVTIYGQQGISVPSGVSSTAIPTATAGLDWISGLAAYNNVSLAAPTLPDPMPATEFTIQVMGSAQNVNGLSVRQSGDFLGFSIEMSVVEPVSECIANIWTNNPI